MLTPTQVKKLAAMKKMADKLWIGVYSLSKQGVPGTYDIMAELDVVTGKLDTILWNDKEEKEFP